MTKALTDSGDARLLADAGAPSTADALALLYLAIPTVVFLVGWIVFPLGLVAGIVVGAAVLALTVCGRPRAWPSSAMLAVVCVATAWTVSGGLGHFVFANSDWVVRDAVLLDLLRDPWPVRYRIDGTDLLLRAPIGYFLPASLVGKLGGVGVAELALLAWTALGVSIVFALMLRDRPAPKAAAIRIAVFVVFSGMDIVGTFAHYNPHAIGDHLEWWAYLFQYSSQTTQLFWVPNHALPGWIAMAWLAGQDPRRLPVIPAILFVLLAPLWSPLTAIGVAPIVGVALLRQLIVVGPSATLRRLVDWRLILPAVACIALVFPYLVAGSEQVASGTNAETRWVGEDIVPRIIEFVLFEFAGFAVLLLVRDRRDVLLWTAVTVLLLLPVYRFGPFNDLAMRASIPALTLLAIRLGLWLSQPGVQTRDRPSRAIAIALLAIGAVTPFNEFARVFIEPRWDMNVHASVPDVTRGTHYLTQPGQPWLSRFLRPPAAP